MSESIRGHLAELYAERRRHREEVAELRHQLCRAGELMALANQSLQALQQLHHAAAEMALSERREVIRLTAVVNDLRAKLLAATAPTAPGACTCRPKDECGQGGDGYAPGTVS